MSARALLVSGLFLSCPAASAWAGSDAGQAGSFLRQEADARGAAMAGAVTALAGDSSAVFWNPAGLSRMVKPEVQGTHITLFEDTSFDALSAGFATRWGSFGAGFLRQSSGGFEKRSSPFDAPTSFSISQTAFMGGWGAALPVPFKPAWVKVERPLEVGFALKAVRESIDSVSASGNGADLGFDLRPLPSAVLGVAVQNVWAPELTFVSRPVGYPKTVDVSPAYALRLADDVGAVLALRLSKTSGRSLSPSGGAEFSYRDLACLRVGDGEKGLSTGFGVRLGNSSFDYSVLLHELGLSHILSFTQRFGYTRQELAESIQKGIRKLDKGEAQRLARTYVRSADLRLKHEDLTGALKDLEAAGLWDPDDAEVPQRIASVKARMDRLLRERMVESTAAMAREQHAKGNYLASRQYWRTVLETAPDHAEAREQLAALDLRLSEEERASQEAQRRQKHELMMRETLDTAQALLKKDQPHQAAAILEEALRGEPGFSAAQMLLEEARSRQRASVEAEMARARSLAAAGGQAQALRVVESVLRDEPRHAEASKLASELRAAAGKVLSDDARRNMEKLYYKAVEAYLAGRYAEARALVGQVMEIDPTSESARKLKDKVDAALSLERP